MSKTVSLPKGSDAESLLDAAARVLPNAHSPYSGVPSSCAVRADSRDFVGVVVESCAYPSSICACVSALHIATTEGAKSIEALAFVGNRESIASPCGRCRAVMEEYGDYPVYLGRVSAGLVVEVKVTSVRELLAGRQTKTEFQSGRRSIGGVPSSYKILNEAEIPSNIKEANLFQIAVEACNSVYVPTSDFPVGAGILTDVGAFSGGNVECLSIGCGLCAERVGVVKAISNGAKSIKAVAVLCLKLQDFGRPCGGCRQVLVEFGEFPVYMLRYHPKEGSITWEMKTSLELLPGAFTPPPKKGE